MATIKGTTLKKTDNYSLFWVSDLSDDLKNVIRSRLSAICHGVGTIELGGDLYCYKSTLKEFLKRYSEKSDDHQKGMIGELLLHILVLEMLDEYEVNSPFFNTEERHVKKGFDIILSKKGENDLWLAESKSGELHAGKNASQTAVDLINAAQSDLYRRLNGDSVSLWLNAINGARLAIAETRDDRAAIISLIKNCGSIADRQEMTSDQINVILVGTVFSDLSDAVAEENIQSKYTRVVNSKKFKQVYIIAIQKHTYKAVYEFLKSESAE